MIYLLQVQTDNFGLQLRTEVVASTLEQLKFEAVEMVKNNPVVKGLRYGIWNLIEKNGKTESVLVKLDTIAK